MARSHSHFDALLAAGRAAPVRDAVVRALRSGAHAAGESYRYGQPRTDGYTYGTDLWRFVCHEMGTELGVLPGAAVRYPRGSFVVDLGDVVLYPFRYGAGPADDVRVARLVDSQFRRELLMDSQTEPPLFWPVVVLVAYAANPEDGLVRAYLGTARIQEHDLLDWHWLEELDLGPRPGQPTAGHATSVVMPRQRTALLEQLQLELNVDEPGERDGMPDGTGIRDGTGSTDHPATDHPATDHPAT